MREDLVKSATIGTSHHKNQVSIPDLLQYFAVDQMQNQAGYIPQKTETSLPEIAPSAETQYCDRKVVLQFLDLRNKRGKHLLTMWVKKFAKAKLHFPDELLPALLDKPTGFGQRDKALYAPLISERAKWLIKQSDKSAWHWVFEYRRTDTNLRENIQENPVFWFQRQREENPTKARQWFSKNFQTMNLLHHAGMIHAFRSGLSEDDRPFLEMLLCPPNDAIVATALYDVILLLSLLNADSVQPNIRNILEMVHVERNSTKGLVIDFCWSGIFEKTDQKRRNNTWIKEIQQCDNTTLCDFIRMVPLDLWSERWQLDFLDMMDGVFKGENGRVITKAWIKRALDEKHENFATTLLCHKENKPLGINDFTNQLLEILSFEHFQDYVADWLSNHE